MSKICSKKLKAHCQILIILTTTISFLGNNVLFSLYKVFKSNKILKQKLADNGTPRNSGPGNNLRFSSIKVFLKSYYKIMRGKMSEISMIGHLRHS